MSRNNEESNGMKSASENNVISEEINGGEENGEKRSEISASMAKYK